MSALNKKGTSRVVSTSRPGVSYNNNPQVLHDDAEQLYQLTVMSLMGKDNYYETNEQHVQRLEQLVNSVVANNQLDFVANTIVYARHKMNIRSMPIALTVYFAKALREQNKTYTPLRRVVADVIARADQITDMYAFALSVFGSKKAVPIAIKRGVADAFNKFNEYQFAKYNSNNKVKLKDVLRIVHPVASNQTVGDIFKRIIDDTLPTPYTWETELSRNGQLPLGERKSSAQLWSELITSGKLGYMALLRNLRNIKEANVDTSVLDIVFNRLENPVQVKNSKQLPFRFVNALDNVKQFSDNKLNRALSRAVDVSLGNVPQIGDNVWIIIDCSGSMQGQNIKTACLFASALAKANSESTNLKVTMFSDEAKHISINTDDSVMSMTDELMLEVYGGGTNLHAALNLKGTLGFNPDTVIVLSDMQVDYLHNVDVNSLFDSSCVKVAFNLDNYDSTPLDVRKGWYQIGGWSDKVFEFIPAIRNKQSIVSSLSHPYNSDKYITKHNVEIVE